VRKIDENKLECVQVDGIDMRDYPDFVDAYISYAEYEGEPLTEDELNNLSPAFIYTQVIYKTC